MLCSVAGRQFLQGRSECTFNILWGGKKVGHRGQSMGEKGLLSGYKVIRITPPRWFPHRARGNWRDRVPHS